jgi:VanZ family protein
MLEQSHIADPQHLPAGVRPQQEARQRAFWLPVVVWMGVIFLLSSIPNASPGSGEFSPRSALAHIVEYGILAYLVCRALYQYESLRSLPRRLSALAMALCLVYGLTDEIHQSFVRFREPSVLDLALDGVGAGLGVALFWLSRRFLYARSHQ